MNKRIQKKWLILLLTVLCVWSGCGQWAVAVTPKTLLPGGMAFGVKLSCDGLIVVGFTEVVTENGSCMPAYDAGLRINDRIVSVNGNAVKTSEEFVKMIEQYNSSVEIGYEREGKACQTRFKPAYCPEEGKYKTGMWIRDTTAGIGTITYLEPETGVFAGLGHGICDPNTGDLLPMRNGTVSEVSISGVTKGTAGSPGELKGYFTEKNTGVLLKNTQKGVYGVLHEIPYDKVPETAVQVAEKEEVQTGEAYIWCTLTDNKTEKYTVCISDISPDTDGTFSVTVTDPRLIEKTGGIVQGMSGSPIIQDGKLIGAVTHVLINDPSKGYGIFIENMLEAAG